MKLVSIIIPTYGGGDYVKNTVVSVLRQSYSCTEIIVVDDNGKGTDNQLKTEEKLKSFIKNCQIKYLIHSINKNGSAARNTGAKVAKGQYFIFLDDDDILKYDAIESQVNTLEKLGLEWGAAYCSMIEYQNGEYYGTTIARKSGEILYELLVHSISAPTSTLLIRKEAFESINGFDQSFYRHQDYEFIARMANQYKIVANPKIGIEKNWINRNLPINIQIRQNYMDYYLKEMDFIIKQFSLKKQREIILYNQLSVAIIYLKNKDFMKFLKRFIELKSGLLGIFIIFKIFILQLLRLIKRKIYFFMGEMK